MGRLARWCEIEGITGFSVSYTSITANVLPTKSEIESKIKSGYTSNIPSSYPSNACVALEDISASMSIGKVIYTTTDQTTSNLMGQLVFYNGSITSNSQLGTIASTNTVGTVRSLDGGQFEMSLNSGKQWSTSGYYYFSIAPSGVWLYRFSLTSTQLSSLNGGLQNVTMSGSKYADITYS